MEDPSLFKFWLATYFFKFFKYYKIKNQEFVFTFKALIGCLYY